MTHRYILPGVYVFEVVDLVLALVYITRIVISSAVLGGN